MSNNKPHGYEELAPGDILYRPYKVEPMEVSRMLLLERRFSPPCAPGAPGFQPWKVLILGRGNRPVPPHTAVMNIGGPPINFFIWAVLNGSGDDTGAAEEKEEKD